MEEELRELNSWDKYSTEIRDDTVFVNGDFEGFVKMKIDSIEEVKWSGNKTMTFSLEKNVSKLMQTRLTDVPRPMRKMISRQNEVTITFSKDGTITSSKAKEWTVFIGT